MFEKNESIEASPDHLLANLELSAVSPFVEMGAYEAMWKDKTTSFKTLAEKFAENKGSFPSQFVDRNVAVAVKVGVKFFVLHGITVHTRTRVHAALGAVLAQRSVWQPPTRAGRTETRMQRRSSLQSNREPQRRQDPQSRN